MYTRMTSILNDCKVYNKQLDVYQHVMGVGGVDMTRTSIILYPYYL